MADVELYDELYVNGCRFGSDDSNGNWKIIKEGANLTIGYSGGVGVYQKVITIDQGGNLNLEAGNFEGFSAFLESRVKIQNDTVSNLEDGFTIGTSTEYVGMRYGSTGCLNLYTILDKDFLISNGKDGEPLLAIESATGLVTISNSLKIDASIEVDGVTTCNGGLIFKEYATVDLPSPSGLAGQCFFDSTLVKIVRSDGSAWVAL